MGRASKICSGRVESKLAKQDFGDDKRYDAMHNDFRKIRDQAGASNELAPGPAPTTGRPGDYWSAAARRLIRLAKRLSPLFQ